MDTIEGRRWKAFAWFRAVSLLTMDRMSLCVIAVMPSRVRAISRGFRSGHKELVNGEFERRLGLGL